MIRVDKEKLRTTAIAVRSRNNSISHAFGEIQTAVVQMDTVWNGSASQNAMEAYNRLKKYILYTPGERTGKCGTNA